MASKKTVKLRVTITDPICCADSELMGFINCLQYAGLLRVHSKDEHLLVLELSPSHGVNARLWAETNKARMATFGYQAEIVVH